MDNSINKELTLTAFIQREYEKQHTAYETEISAFKYIQQGDLKNIDAVVRLFLSDSTGHLSDDPRRNYQYLFVAAITLITRLCIEGGLEPETAYNLSDLYIQKMDLITTTDGVIALFRTMATDFTKRMAALEKEKVYSKPIVKCFDYIYDHLHEIISIEDLSENVELSPSYLSTLFKKETGQTIAAYIRNKRIEAAKNMLKYSEYTYLDISNILAFNSHSHFISVFKQSTGFTPREYRQKYYRSNWK